MHTLNPRKQERVKKPNFHTVYTTPHLQYTPLPPIYIVQIFSSSVRLQVRTPALLVCNIISRHSSSILLLNRRGGSFILQCPHRSNITGQSTCRCRRGCRSTRNGIGTRRNRMDTPRCTPSPALKNRNLHLQILDLLLLTFTFSLFVAIYTSTPAQLCGNELNREREGTSIV